MQLEVIENKIYEIRGQKVMLDFDLAELYETETRVLKQAVRRNIRRFPTDFMFELTRNEYNFLRSQSVMLEKDKGRGRYSKFNPFAFTEQGVAMLSSVLNSDKAIEINIAVMRAFLVLRDQAIKHNDLAVALKKLEEKYDQKFIDIEAVLDYLVQKDEQQIQQQKRKKIGYKMPKTQK